MGLEALLGEDVTLWCECRIYAGMLVGVHDTYVVLEDASVVYDAVVDKSGLQHFASKYWYVQTSKIESYRQS